MKKHHKPEDPFAFDPRGLSPEIIKYLDNIRFRKERQRFITQAIEFMYEYDHYKPGFLIRMMQENYVFCRKKLRKIGAAMRLLVDRDKKFMEKTNAEMPKL